MKEDGFHAVRGNDEYIINDDRAVLEFFNAHKQDDAASLTHAVCTNTDFWGEDLSKLPGFEESVAQTLKAIEENGTYEVMKACLA